MGFGKPPSNDKRLWKRSVFQLSYGIKNMAGKHGGKKYAAANFEKILALSFQTD